MTPVMPRYFAKIGENLQAAVLKVDLGVTYAVTEWSYRFGSGVSLTWRAVGVPPREEGYAEFSLPDLATALSVHGFSLICVEALVSELTLLEQQRRREVESYVESLITS